MVWQFGDNDDKEKDMGKEEEEGNGGGGGCSVHERLAELEDHKVSRKLVAYGAVGGRKFVEHEMLGTIAMPRYISIQGVGPKGGREVGEKGEEERRGSGGGGVDGEAKEVGNGEKHELPATPVSLKWLSAKR